MHHYDNASRTGPKIFVGEWATRSGSPTPNFGDALGDAAWMTSMERNSDLIVMASYAPLFVNVNPGAMQWPTDLIGYDALNTYGFAELLRAMPVLRASRRRHGEDVDHGAGALLLLGDGQSSDHVLHLKLVNASNLPQPLTLVNSGDSARAKHSARR